jgi:hypothetical protein
MSPRGDQAPPCGCRSQPLPLAPCQAPIACICRASILHAATTFVPASLAWLQPRVCGRCRLAWSISRGASPAR